jgi:DNA modification methylase
VHKDLNAGRISIFVSFANLGHAIRWLFRSVIRITSLDFTFHEKWIIDEKGINLSDFWEDTSPLRHISRKHRNSNELPKLIFDRVLSISGAPNEFYIDPFAGSGSGVIGAAELKMKFLCCDLLESNCSIIANRLENFV